LEEETRMSGLELYMVGLHCRNIEMSLEFYRRLGMAVPEGAEHRTHVEVPVRSGMTLYFNSQGGAGVPDSPHVVFEFYLKERGAVDTKHAEMMSAGYQNFSSPREMPFGMYFAYIVDPDGNLVLLSAD
jgi:catechol 2,3-dioxygenase-like lactoylglutathione lyase family enzyme